MHGHPCLLYAAMAGSAGNRPTFRTVTLSCDAPWRLCPLFRSYGLHRTLVQLPALSAITGCNSLERASSRPLGCPSGIISYHQASLGRRPARFATGRPRGQRAGVAELCVFRPAVRGWSAGGVLAGLVRNGHLAGTDSAKVNPAATRPRPATHPPLRRTAVDLIADARRDSRRPPPRLHSPRSLRGGCAFDALTSALSPALVSGRRSPVSPGPRLPQRPLYPIGPGESGGGGCGDGSDPWQAARPSTGSCVTLASPVGPMRPGPRPTTEDQLCSSGRRRAKSAGTCAPQREGWFATAAPGK